MTQENSPPPIAPPPTPPASPAAGLGAMTHSSGYDGPPPTKDDTNMAMLIYILGIFTGFLGPLILWLVKKDQSKFIDDQGKEVLNFQITVFIALVICGVLTVVLIGLFLLPIVWIAALVLMIMGAMKANQGIAYRFPFALRLLK